MRPAEKSAPVDEAAPAAAPKTAPQRRLHRLSRQWPNPIRPRSRAGSRLLRREARESRGEDSRGIAGVVAIVQVRELRVVNRCNSARRADAGRECRAAEAVAAPEPIREAVNGNVYTNETYRFHMYKPPDWDLIAAAPAVLPGAITAMGTGDDMTYFLIGQEPAGKSLATNMDTTEKRLRDVMVNFRALDEKQITVSGTAVTEHRFRGSVDQHDWSGVVVIVPRGAKLFTIFGMTRADNDLVQIQENVIARAISSLQFTD